MSLQSQKRGHKALKYICFTLLFMTTQMVQQLSGQQIGLQTSDRGDEPAGGQGGTTLVVSQNADGSGLSIADQATNGQITSTTSGNLEVNSNELAQGQEDLVVAGLLEWLKNKKREKEEKKNKQKQPIILPYPVQPQPIMPQPIMPQPILPQPILPQPVPVRPRKEIHIHINNHIKKDSHKHHGGHKKHYSGHYEDYHDGGYHDVGYHDKYYPSKHSYPLLAHHYSFGGYHDDGHYGHHHDDYGHEHSGYESQQKPQYVKMKEQKQRQWQMKGSAA